MASNDRRVKAQQRTVASENTLTRINVRRILILDNLQAYSEPVPLEEIANAVAAFGRGDRDRSAGDARRTRISLHHVDLPLLSKLGFVEYDSEKRTVALTDAGRLLIN